MAEARSWFRLYTEFAFDPKVQLLDETLQRRYVMLLCAAAAGMSPFHAVSEAAFLLRIPVSECEQTRSILVSKGLITEDWFPVAWDKRQFQSDTSTSRVKRFRQRQKGVSQTVTETPSEQSRTEQIQNRAEQTKSASVSEPVNKERKVRKKRNAEPFNPANVPGLDIGSWNAWVAYRAERKPAIKDVSMQAAAEELAAFGSQQAAVVRHSKANGYQGLVPPTSDGPRLAPTTLTHEERERRELQALKDRRSRIGLQDFRDPLPHETAGMYRAAQDDEWAERQDGRTSARRDIAGKLQEAAQALKVPA